jgi:DNA-binding MarR family transcriptional regulator
MPAAADPGESGDFSHKSAGKSVYTVESAQVLDPSTVGLEGAVMKSGKKSGLAECNCLAIRQAARHVTQFYDQALAPTGLRATQYAILSRLRRDGPLAINALAAALVMDRTTMGRNILPLQRDGLIEIVASDVDRRRRELRLSAKGLARQRAADELWEAAQAGFEGALGRKRSAKMRNLMREISDCEFAAIA